MASRKEKRSNNQQPSEEQAKLKLQEQIKHWQLKATDQTLELELLRAQKDSNSANLQSERETLINELESVQTSLHTLSTQNESFKQLIAAKKALVDSQGSEIQQKSENIDNLSQRLEKLVEEDKERALAPELSVIAYCKMLADRGDAEKLDQLSKIAYSQISFVVQQNNLRQMQEQFAFAQKQQAANQENGAAAPQFDPNQQNPFMMNGMPNMMFNPMMQQQQQVFDKENTQNGQQQMFYNPSMMFGNQMMAGQQMNGNAPAFPGMMPPQQQFQTPKN